MQAILSILGPLSLVRTHLSKVQHTCRCCSRRSFSALSVSGRGGRNLNLGISIALCIPEGSAVLPNGGGRGEGFPHDGALIDEELAPRMQHKRMH